MTTLLRFLPMPHSWPRWTSHVRRAYAGVTPTVLGLVAALLLVFELTRTVKWLPTAIDDHAFGEWFGVVCGDATFHLILAGLVLGLLVPAMNLGPDRGWRRYLVLATCVAVASLVCAAARIAYWLFDAPFPPGVTWTVWMVQYTGRYGFMCAMLTVLAEFYRYETRSIDRMHQAEVDRLTLDRELTEARLQVLQAQIEPHFLFNTLANVRRLYRTDVAAGRLMLEHLMRYLEVALPRMRDNTSTLEREAALIEAYLSVQQIRMGRRLAFAVDVPDSLRASTVPSMMLLTLVENAIKHGLNPLREGGRIDVVARVEAERLVIRVADTGRGFGGDTSGGGTGIANIQARLSALHGPRASLDLEENSPTGIVATLRVPRPTPAARGAAA